jgi:hypothetical protein
MPSRKQKSKLALGLTKAKRRAARVTMVKELSPVVWGGWQIRRGEKYFGLKQRADGTRRADPS